MHDPEPEGDVRPLRLPDPGTPPAFPPSRAALDEALTRARHRKLTRGLAVSLAALAVPAAVLFGLPDRARQDSLQFARTPSTSATPAADPEPSAVPPPLTALPRRGTAPGGAAEQEPPTRPRDGAPPPAAPQEGGEPLLEAPVKPEHRESPQEVPGGDCGRARYVGSAFTETTCLRGEAPDSVQRGEPIELVTSFCVSRYGTFSIPLQFRGGQEHDVIVREQVRDENGAATGRGKILWTWSHTVTFPEGPHRRTLAPGRCLTWSTPWRTEDRGGDALPPGEYFVEYRMTASSWGGATGRSVRIVD